MMQFHSLLFLAHLLLPASSFSPPGLPAGGEDDAGWQRLGGLTAGEVSGELGSASLRFLDLDGEPGEELLHVGAGGVVEVLTWRAESGTFQRLGTPLELPEPRRSLLTLRDLLGTGGRQLVVLDGSGLRAHPVDGSGLGEAVSLSRRARLVPRTSVPAFADFVRDVGNDGRPDVVVPGFRSCELWLAEESGPDAPTAAPRLRKVATLAVSEIGSSSRASGSLADQLTSGLIIPDLGTEDVNGDGLEDLVVSSRGNRSFYLQGADGSFPAEPTTSVSLSIFKDTSPRPEVRPGQIIADDRRSDERRDLDGDGIPDHVIAHRRKVWVFHGDENGPQFEEPSTVLKVAEDVTALTVLPVDKDDYPDLVLLKFELPGIAELVMGVVGKWTVQLRVIGYRNLDGRSFGRTPEWRVEHELELPPILDVLRNPERFLSRFEDIEATVQGAARGDLDGDGSADLVLVKSEGKDTQPWIGVWQGQGGSGEGGELDGDAAMRRILFEDSNTRWDLERLASTLSSLAGARLESLTGGREPDLRGEALARGKHELVDLVASDLDGDGTDELCVLYVDPKSRRSVRLEVLGLGPAASR